MQDDPDPSPEVAEIWAEGLGDDVVPEHILTYAFLRRASMIESANDEVIFDTDWSGWGCGSPLLPHSCSTVRP